MAVHVESISVAMLPGLEALCGVRRPVGRLPGAGGWSPTPFRILKRSLPTLCLVVASQGLVAAPEEWVEPTTGMQFVRAPKGCFNMGTPVDPASGQVVPFGSRIRNEIPEHEVCLEAFWVARHEVRIDDWNKVMAVAPAEAAQNNPVASVSWASAQAFVRNLNAQSAGVAVFQLPTEAQWEYACRAGAKSAVVNHQAALENSAWFSSSYGGNSSVRINQSQPVGTKSPNPWGLHDMLGNVWEWVSDSYDAEGYRRHALHEPRVESPPGRKVIRGGSVRSADDVTRCEARSWLPETDKLDTVGFRLVRVR